MVATTYTAVAFLLLEVLFHTSTLIPNNYRTEGSLEKKQAVAGRDTLSSRPWGNRAHHLAPPKIFFEDTLEMSIILSKAWGNYWAVKSFFWNIQIFKPPLRCSTLLAIIFSLAHLGLGCNYPGSLTECLANHTFHISHHLSRAELKKLFKMVHRTWL